MVRRGGGGGDTRRRSHTICQRGSDQQPIYSHSTGFHPCRRGSLELRRLAVVVAAFAQLVQRELAGTHAVRSLNLLQAFLELAHHADARVSLRVVVLLGRRGRRSGLVLLACGHEAGGAGQRLARRVAVRH